MGYRYLVLTLPLTRPTSHAFGSTVFLEEGEYCLCAVSKGCEVSFCLCEVPKGCEVSRARTGVN